jgi:hypothetical protein
MDQAESNRRQRCFDCGQHSPKVSTNYSLIGGARAWRVSVVVGPDGKKTSIWRCPSCWKKLRTEGTVGTNERRR